VSRPSPIEEAKAKHRLVEVARRTGLPVREGQAGSVTVRCPMPSHGHPDRTPSMRLHLDNDVWFCFACSPRKPDGNPVGADVVEWVRRTENVSWRDAVALLDSGRPLTNAWAGPDPGAGARRHIVRQPGGIVGSGAGERPDLGRTPAERVRQALRAAWAYYSCEALHQRADAYPRSFVLTRPRGAGRPDRGVEVVVVGRSGRLERRAGPLGPVGWAPSRRRAALNWPVAVLPAGSGCSGECCDAPVGVEELGEGGPSVEDAYDVSTGA